MKKTVSVILALALVFCMGIPAFAANTDTVKDYTITSPYDIVDWDNWKAAKTQLHCHTTASDGYLTVAESVQMHYDLGYDMVCITDHGTIGKGWDVAPDTVPLIRLIKYERTQLAPIVPLTAEEKAAYENGTHTTSEGIIRGFGMTDIPTGIELNMATPIADCHLTGYFSDYGQGLAGVFGDYETPSEGVKDSGGISMLAHVGEYVYTDKDSADHVGQKVDDYYPTKFARLFLDNAGSSVGMGINSATDAHTRCDRILWDQILQKTIPNGVTPWGFAFSDSHNDTSVNDAWQVLWMPEISLDGMRETMINGASFAVTHFSNGVELNGMEEMPGYVEENQDWTINNLPAVTRITVDESADTITVEGTDFNQITWVSNGNVILREDVPDGKATLDLHSSGLLDTPYLYVRFYITSADGICYSQPMTIQRDGEVFASVDVPEVNDTPKKLRTLVTVLDWVNFKWNPIVWIFKHFALGYDPIERTLDSVKDLFSKAMC